MEETWRDFLREIVATPEKRQEIADGLGVRTKTLERWMNGETELPRPYRIRQLLSLLPPQQREPMFSLILADPKVQVDREEYRVALQQYSVAKEIPPEFVDRVLSAIAAGSNFSTISDLILHQSLQLLDPDRLGMNMLIVQSMPAQQDGKVHSVYVRSGRRSTSPGDIVAGRYFFLGAESLCGYCVAVGEAQCIQDRSDLQNRIPVRIYEPLEDTTSLAAVPFQRGNQVAGCLLATSSQVNYFTKERLDLLRQLANLLMLAFNQQEDFSPVESIELGFMPSVTVQQAYFEHFAQRVLTLMKQAKKGESITHIEAQRRLLCEIEQQLLQQEEQGE